MARTRAKQMGRIGGEAEPYARIPISVLESEAVKTLDHAAFKILVIIASDCWWHPVKMKGRNGTAAFTESFQKKWGFKGRDTLYRALRELTDRGLLVRTRDGQRIRNRFALYGLGWLPITHRDAQLLNQPEPAPDLWKRWKPTAISIPKVGSDAEKFLTDGRDCSTPAIGSGPGEYVPMVGNTDPKYTPTIGHTSLRIGHPAPRRRSTRPTPRQPVGRGAAVRAPRAPPTGSLSNAAISKLMTMMIGDPDKSDSDLATIFACEHTEVASVRQRIARLSGTTGYAMRRSE